MSRTIWKYDLEPGYDNVFKLGDPKVIHVGTQFPHFGFDDQPIVWIEHDPSAPQRTLALNVYGTGHPIAEGDSHVGSVWLPSSGLVWHVYQVTT